MFLLCLINVTSTKEIEVLFCCFFWRPIRQLLCPLWYLCADIQILCFHHWLSSFTLGRTTQLADLLPILSINSFSVSWFLSYLYRYVCLPQRQRMRAERQGTVIFTENCLQMSETHRKLNLSFMFQLPLFQPNAESFLCSHKLYEEASSLPVLFCCAVTFLWLLLRNHALWFMFSCSNNVRDMLWSGLTGIKLLGVGPTRHQLFFILGVNPNDVLKVHRKRVCFTFKGYLVWNTFYLREPSSRRYSTGICCSDDCIERLHVFKLWADRSTIRNLLFLELTIARVFSSAVVV